ncbi:MAG: ribosome small subunit-dependent GTPase A, partial [Candidatus Marinimicrobia bacterium]|nr:ribosome small subunit-dependent GTPase A [Candidatus Neomarinimicrobiota bacterium]
MTSLLKRVGFSEEWERRFKNLPEDIAPGRVITEYKKRYLVRMEKGDMEAELSGRLQYKATSREDLPVVGDWVALMLEGEKALIRYVVERKSVLA